MSRRDGIEDGMGFSGLVESAEDRWHAKEIRQAEERGAREMAELLANDENIHKKRFDIQDLIRQWRESRSKK